MRTLCATARHMSHNLCVCVRARAISFSLFFTHTHIYTHTLSLSLSLSRSLACSRSLGYLRFSISRIGPAPWKFLQRHSPHVRPPRWMGSDTCRLPSFARQKRKSHPIWWWGRCPCPLCGCRCPLRTETQSRSTWSPG